MKVAIQGIDSSYHARAARAMFGDTIDLVHCDTFAEVFTSVTEGLVEYGVAAIENSLYGSINDTYDLLLEHQLHICAETYQQISLHLLGTDDSSLESITDVFSQAPALSEASEFLDTKLSNAKRHEYNDTASAARFVAQSKTTTNAAIASMQAAKEFGLHVLAENIETHHDNYTRFIALSQQEPSAPNGDTKTSITFETSDTPGSLYAALGVFADRNINLTKLESRPIIGKAWTPMYYIDFTSAIDKELLAELKQSASNIRILGTYPAGRSSA
ncbi:prephenate dehydratase [Candidatus Saccharibacteria bacterium]|nr:prephenate dehydratase [Candidatus Saccharibacteria bacterium]